MRIINLLVIAALILAASFVYKIKFDSTLQAERVAKLRSEIRKERESIARFRADWAKLESPARVQGLSMRHLPQLKAAASTQYDDLDNLPERPLPMLAPAGSDPIGAMLAPKETTGSISAPGRQ